ncbi:MAG TPA: hypothetical protein DCQ06_13235 [Myxococcales bacterium]|nr:hypothetical protein [Myxococcales bacterium]HAN32553.1 hypothetical protein [Myxococcales bacterium]
MGAPQIQGGAMSVSVERGLLLFDPWFSVVANMQRVRLARYRRCSWLKNTDAAWSASAQAASET